MTKKTKQAVGSAGTAGRSGGLVLIGRREPPQELVEETTWGLVEQDLAQFARDVDTAREMWRSHRDLVEAPEMSASLVGYLNESPGNSGILRERILADPQFTEVLKELTTKTEAVHRDFILERARRMMRGRVA